MIRRKGKGISIASVVEGILFGHQCDCGGTGLRILAEPYSNTAFDYYICAFLQHERGGLVEGVGSPRDYTCVDVVLLRGTRFWIG